MAKIDPKTPQEDNPSEPMQPESVKKKAAPQDGPEATVLKTRKEMLEDLKQNFDLDELSLSPGEFEKMFLKPDEEKP